MSAGSSKRVIGVLLAAGRGRRMNGAKQFEPWPTPQGTLPLVCAAYDAIQTACDKMLVVLGHRASEVSELLGDRTFQRVESDPDAPMFDSIAVGLRAAQEIDKSAAVLLHLGDHPEVAPNTLRIIIETASRDPELAVMPEYQGKGGHPVLISPTVRDQVLSANCPQGLKQFWRENPQLCQRIAVDDPCVVQDIDYPRNS